MLIFYAADGSMTSHSAIDDIICEILGLPVQEYEYSKEYKLLTQNISKYNDWDEMDNKAESEDLKKLARGMRARHITYVTGRTAQKAFIAIVQANKLCK